MKVIITTSSLPVPVGTIMDVGAEIPAAWRGKCVPYIEEPKRRIILAREQIDEYKHDVNDTSLVKPVSRKKN